MRLAILEGQAWSSGNPPDGLNPQHLNGRLGEAGLLTSREPSPMGDEIKLPGLYVSRGRGAGPNERTVINPGWRGDAAGRGHKFPGGPQLALTILGLLL